MSPPQVVVAVTMLSSWPAVMIVEEVKVVIKVETGMVDIGGIGIISRGRGDHVTPANTSKNVRMQQNKYKIT